MTEERRFEISQAEVLEVLGAYVARHAGLEGRFDISLDMEPMGQNRVRFTLTLKRKIPSQEGASG